MPASIPAEEIYAGDTWSRSFEIRRRDATDPAVSAPVDLVADGWGGWIAQWRSRADSSEEPIELGVDASQAADGVMTLSATAAQTRAMRQSGVWDLQASRGSEVRTWLAGSFTWGWDVTRV